MRRGSPGRGRAGRGSRHEGPRMEERAVGGKPSGRPNALRAHRRFVGFGSVRPVITPAMVARSGSVADPRWSPAGTRLAWVVSLRRPIGSRGRSRRRVGTAGDRHRRHRHRGRLTPGSMTTSSSWPAATAGLVVVGAQGQLVRTLTRDGRALAPAVSVRGEVALSIERDDACDVVVVPLDGSAWPATAIDGDYAWDATWSPDGSRLAWHEWDLPDLPWDASRIVVRDDSGAAKVVAGGDAIGVGPAAVLPGGRPRRVRQRRRGLADRVDRRSRRRRRASGAARGPGARGAGVGVRPTVVRVVARRQRTRVVSQRGRLRPAGDRLAGHALGARAVEGLASRTRLERARHRLRPVRCGDTRRRWSCSRRTARAGAPSRADRSAGSRRRRWSSRARCNGRTAARTCTGCCTGRPSTRAAAHRASSTADRPVRPSPTGTPRVQWLVQRGCAVLQPNYRGSTGIRARVHAGTRRALGRP